MKMQSAAIGKGTRSGVPVQSRNEPREGTTLREIFDSFQANKGVPIRTAPLIGHMVEVLRDVYGMDILCLERGYGNQKGRKIRQALWVFAGEWFGDKYVDYIAQRIEDKES